MECPGIEIQRSGDEETKLLLGHRTHPWTETKNKKDNVIGIPGFEVEFQNDYNSTKKGAGGVAIFVKRGIKRETLCFPQNARDFDVCGVRIEGDNMWLNIVCIYRRPNLHVRNGAWMEVLKNVNRNEAVIVADDFNAHHRAWNCEKTESIEERLMEEFESVDLFIVNDNTKTRIGEIGQMDSNIDLIFANDKAIDLIKYSVAEETWGSDHYPVLFDIEMDRRIYKKITNRISNKLTDWSAYQAWLEDNIREIENEKYKGLSREERYERFMTLLKTSVYKAKKKREDKRKGQGLTNGSIIKKDKLKNFGLNSVGKVKNNRRKNNVGKSRNRKKRNPFKWWDRDCEDAIEERKIAQKEYSKKRTLELESTLREK